MADSVIVQVWYNTKARLLAIIIQLLKKVFVQSLSLRVDLSAVPLFIQLYDRSVSLRETNRMFLVNLPELILVYF